MNKNILYILITTGVLLFSFSTVGKGDTRTGKSHSVSDKSCSGKLLNRSDSVSYAVGLLLGQQIKDSIAGWEPELFRFGFMAGMQESQTDSKMENIPHKLVADYKKQHTDSLKITEKEIQTQAMGAYMLGLSSMMLVKSYLLFDKKSGNPEVLYNAVLSVTVQNSTRQELVMNVEECQAYLESVQEKSAKEAWEMFNPD